MDRYQGFREFVQARGPALSRTAFLLCGNHVNAEELLQEALAKTARHWRRVVEGGNPEGYVRKVMVNQRNTWWRRLGRREQTVAELPEKASIGDTGSAVTDRLTLLRALAALPPRQRAVVVLRYYEDFSVVDVAIALGVSEGTVKSQSHAALTKLRELLSDARIGELEVRL